MKNNAVLAMQDFKSAPTPRPARIEGQFVKWQAGGGDKGVNALREPKQERICCAVFPDFFLRRSRSWLKLGARHVRLLSPVWTLREARLAGNGGQEAKAHVPFDIQGFWRTLCYSWDHSPPKAQAARAMWEVVVLVVVLPEYSLFLYFFVLSRRRHMVYSGVEGIPIGQSSRDAVKTKKKNWCAGW